ncbi:hypothetical protein [Streptomyces sp. NPDC001450]
MRVLPARRLASTTLCAALLVGIAGPAAVAADSARGRTHAGSHSAVPGADALLAQVRSLRNVDPVLNPVIDLLEQSLQKGRLTPDQARKLGDAAKEAIAEATAGAPTAPATHTTPATPTTPASPSMAAASAAPLPAAFAKSDVKVPQARDLTDDLQNAIDALLQAVTSNLDALPATVTGAVSDLVDLVDLITSALDGLPLPLPSLPADPSLPTG